jgi:hypothetical protein
MKVTFFLAFLILLTGCSHITYRTPDHHQLTVYTFGIDTTVGEMTAKVGDTTLTLKNATADVDPATVKAIDDALQVALELLSKIPSTGMMATSQPSANQMQAVQNALNTARALIQKLPTKTK